MIARTWNGRLPAHHADGFARHLSATGVAEAAALPGHLGADVFRADVGEHVEFRLVTYWRSWEAIQSFAGEEPDRAVLYPGDEEYELVPSFVVEHHHVIHRSGEQ